MLTDSRAAEHKSLNSPPHHLQKICPNFPNICINTQRASTTGAILLREDHFVTVQRNLFMRLLASDVVLLFQDYRSAADAIVHRLRHTKQQVWNLSDLLESQKGFRVQKAVSWAGRRIFDGLLSHKCVQKAVLSSIVPAMHCVGTENATFNQPQSANKDLNFFQYSVWKHDSETNASARASRGLSRSTSELQHCILSWHGILYTHNHIRGYWPQRDFCLPH